MDGLEAKTYTNIWNQDKKLYSIYELELPTPVSFRQIGLFFIGALLWAPLMYVLHVPISNAGGFILWVAPPFVLAWIGNRPIFEDKTLFQWLFGFIGFFFEPKAIMDGRAVSKDELMASDDNINEVGQHHYEISVWQRRKITQPKDNK